MKKINHAIYTNKMKEKYHMAHLIDGDKPFDKTQQPFMLRISHQNRSRRKNPQSDQRTANFLLTCETLCIKIFRIVPGTKVNTKKYLQNKKSHTFLIYLFRNATNNCML